MKLLLKKLACFIPLLTVLMAVNFFADPYAVFNDEQISNDDIWVAEQLSIGRNVLYYGNWDQRQVQVATVERFAARGQKVDVAVFGSSRALQINKSLFLGKFFFNSSVTGASLQDAIAMYEVYKAFRVSPSLVIVGIDPWMFNKNNESEEWRSLDKYYTHYVEVKSRPSLFNRLIAGVRSNWPTLKKRVMTIVSPKYFQHSLAVRQAPLKSKIHKIVEDQFAEDGPVKAADGSLVNSKEFREKDAGKIEDEVRDYVSTQHIYGLNSFERADAELKLQFIDWLHYLRNERKDVVVFLAPYHPLTYARIATTPEYAGVVEIESFIVKTCHQLGVQVVGSYDPAKVGFTNKDFYDFMHPKREAVERLFAKTKL